MFFNFSCYDAVSGLCNYELQKQRTHHLFLYLFLQGLSVALIGQMLKTKKGINEKEKEKEGEVFTVSDRVSVKQSEGSGIFHSHAQNGCCHFSCHGLAEGQDLIVDGLSFAASLLLSTADL